MLVAGNGYRVSPKFVTDGDTLNLDYLGYQFTARLQWIDTPETQKNHTSNNPLILSHWQWAQKAKSELLNLVYGKDLIAVPIEKDIYDRWITDLYVGRVSATTNVQIALCKLGMCSHFLPFNRFKFSSRELVIMRGILTETARSAAAKRGIWSVPNFILPAEFKKLTSY